MLSYSTSLALLAPALTLIAIGYGLAVPCLTTLFSHVPVEQGIMQGIAGAIDRFGQAFGPVVGGVLLKVLGEAGLMRWTGVGLAIISSICLAFIGEGCLNWMRELFCHTAAGYKQVTTLDSIAEEDEDELEMEAYSPASSPKRSPAHGAKALPAVKDANGHAPLGALPASVSGGR